MSTRILALVGSLRAGSYNRQLAEAAVKHAPDDVDVEIYDGLAEVPFYNEDLDRPAADPPAAAEALRAAAAGADALLLVTPEYNGTFPAVLKNAIDWLSRPYRGAMIAAKPVAVIGTAASRYGGSWAHRDARKTVRIAGGTVLDDITFSVPHAPTRFATTHPACDSEVATALPAILIALAAAVRAASTGQHG